MFGRNNATLYLVLIAMIGLGVTTASARLYDPAYTALAYDQDGVGGVAPWFGTIPFSKTVGGKTLAGDLDWAVYRGDDFVTLFGDTDYDPTLGDLVYAYQIHNEGTVSITLNEVYILGGAPVENAGWFQNPPGVAGQIPYESRINPAGSLVIWDFRDATGQTPPDLNYNVDPGESSMGLAFSSIRKPKSGLDLMVNGTISVNIAGVASPGLTDIPEPSVFTLLAAAAVSLGFSVIRRQRRK
jgi:hypothetical protein